MKRGIWIAIAVGIVLILVGVVVILMFVPLGAKLTIPTPSSVFATTVPATSLVPATIPPTVPAASATPQAKPCGSGSLTVMVLGESQPPRGTDAIRLVRVDFDHKRIDILSLPSELWVSTPGLFGNGIGGATLNQVYLKGKVIATGDEQAHLLAAVNLFAGTLQANFGYTPEHYFVIKETAFSEFVDALNGVDVVLPVAVDGRAEGMGYYPAGSQHLTGAMALNLVRISAAGEKERTNHQDLIIQAVYLSLEDPHNWDRLPALVQAFHDKVFTDLSASQMLESSCILNQAGVVVSQEQVGPDLVTMSGQTMLPGPGLSQYIQQTVGK
jgi:anionic cell wall polymer biosynthesis LytR-Cps2A-Psr (LCP) family protein